MPMPDGLTVEVMVESEVLLVGAIHINSSEGSSMIEWE
jgi:hypothetical protein